MTLLLWKWGLLLGVPTLLVLGIWFPFGIIPALIGLVFGCILVPAGFTLQFWLFTKMGTACGIYKRGLGVSSGYGGSMCRWEEITSHHFEDFSEIPAMRCLYATYIRRGQEAKLQLIFSPEQVSEEEIKQLVQSHLPPRSQ